MDKQREACSSQADYYTRDVRTNERTKKQIDMKKIFLIIPIVLLASEVQAWYGTSPYAYCVGDPVNYVDVDGVSIVVLINQNGAYGYGHMGVLLQNEEGKWDYYSKNGRNETPTLGVGNFDSPESFLASEFGASYTQAFVIGDGRAYEEKAIETITEKLNEPYFFFSSNCAQAVQAALRDAGLPPGIPQPLPMDYNQPGSGLNLIFQSMVPNAIFNNIVIQNIGMIDHGRNTKFHYRMLTK